ncbi:MAG TPA: LacI family DNA-binding transcriptional regulator [Ruminiclostridium sp.]
MRVTLKDIAKQTGLSVTTISLVLNNKPNNISEKTKKLIFETSGKLNYHPNQLAVGLVKRETNTIGLIIPDISNQFFAELALGIDDEAYKHNLNIIFSNTSDKTERDISSLNILYSRGVDAIIIAMASNIDNEKRRLYQNIISDISIPIIFVDRHDPSFNCSSVKLNNKKGAYIATSHLLSLGHKEIACITGAPGLRSTGERLEGFRWAFNDFGIDVCEDYIYEGNYLHSGGYNAAKKIINTPVTAIFAFNDMMAFGAFRMLYQAGLQIPNDISVIGFDDIYFSELLEVPLTTVRQPAYEIGCEAVRRAIIEIGDKNIFKQNISFEPELIIRKSTGKRKERKNYENI